MEKNEKRQMTDLFCRETAGTSKEAAQAYLNRIENWENMVWERIKDFHGCAKRMDT